MIVKICGITRKEDLRAISKTGCDWVGFITGFPKSPRNLSPDSVVEMVAETPEPLEPVVVCPSSEQGLIEYILSRVPPYALQLYGEEHPKVSGVKLIKAIRVSDELTVDTVLEKTRGYDFILLDSPTPGSGKPHDWLKSREIRTASPIPTILSGGLNPSNILEAIKTVKPHGVDSSSGVEKTAGIKDLAKIIKFVKLAKQL